MSIYLYVYLYVYISQCLNISMSKYLYVYKSMCLYFYVFVKISCFFTLKLFYIYLNLFWVFLNDYKKRKNFENILCWTDEINCFFTTAVWFRVFMRKIILLNFRKVWLNFVKKCLLYKQQIYHFKLLIKK